MSTTFIDYNGPSQNPQPEYETLLEQLRLLQTEWHNLTSRKAMLESSVASITAQCNAIDPIRARLQELREETVTLAQRGALLEAQIEEAKNIYRHTCVEMSNFTNDANSEKRSLEGEYMSVMRLIDDFDPHLQEDAVLLRAALSEQRVEMRVLREAMEAVRQSVVPEYSSELMHLPSASLLQCPPSMVEVPMDDVQIPVERGKLRLLTGPRGDGLQQLRDRHKVTVSILCLDDAVSVRVQGHTGGVENCVHDIRRSLFLCK